MLEVASLEHSASNGIRKIQHRFASVRSSRENALFYRLCVELYDVGTHRVPAKNRARVRSSDVKKDVDLRRDRRHFTLPAVCLKVDKVRAPIVGRRIGIGEERARSTVQA